MAYLAPADLPALALSGGRRIELRGLYFDHVAGIADAVHQVLINEKYIGNKRRS